ncbi:cation transporter [Marinilabiliaceae bacterium JC017]|nr:cation transporter [Marinilabiliaceae bacterium JC017]
MLMVTLFMAVNTASANNNKKEIKEVVFNVSMHCQSCADKITKYMSFEKGVKEINADVKAQTVKLKYRADKTNEESLKAALKKIGYEATVGKGNGCTMKCNSSCETDHDHHHQHEHHHDH